MVPSYSLAVGSVEDILQKLVAFLDLEGCNQLGALAGQLQRMIEMMFCSFFSYYDYFCHFCHPEME